MKISKNFSLEEFTKSAAAESLKINNTPSMESVVNLCALVHNVLQPLRDVVGKPIRINSGYRSEGVNKAIGGAAHSQHMRGQAADIRVMDVTPTVLGEMIKNLYPFDQLIIYPTFVHVSYSIYGNRGERIFKRGRK